MFLIFISSVLTGIWTANGYAEGAEPCGAWNNKASKVGGYSSGSDPATNASIVAGASIGAIFAALLMIFMLARSRGNRRMRHNNEPGQRRGSNIAAVREIS